MFPSAGLFICCIFYPGRLSKSGQPQTRSLAEAVLELLILQPHLLRAGPIEYAPVLGSSCTFLGCPYPSYLYVLAYVVIHMTLHMYLGCTVRSGSTPHRVCTHLACLGQASLVGRGGRSQVQGYPWLHKVWEAMLAHTGPCLQNPKWARCDGTGL